MPTLRFEWRLSPKQRVLFDSHARYRTAMCGRRFGKNELGTAALIDYATQPNTYPFGADTDPTCWWVGPTYNQSWKYGFRKTREKLPKRLINGKPKRSPPYQVNLETGAELEYYSYDNPDGLQGAGVDFMVIDEAAYMKQSVWEDDLHPMLLDAEGGVLFISKPMGENWFHDLYQLGQDPDEPQFFSVRATSYENPFIRDEVIDEQKRLTPESVFRQQYLADPKAGGGSLTRDMLHWTTPDQVPDRPLTWITGVDLATVDDPKRAQEEDTNYWAAFVVAYDAQAQQAYGVDCHRVRGMRMDEAVAWLARIQAQLPNGVAYIEANQAQDWFRQECEKQGLRVHPVRSFDAKHARLMSLSVPASNEKIQFIDHDDPGTYERGREHDERWDSFINEWTGFPNAHTDLLDALDIALDQVNLGLGIQAATGDAYGQA